MAVSGTNDSTTWKNLKKSYSNAHYTTVLDLVMKAKNSLWIGTADIGEFDKVWRRKECGKCGQKDMCMNPTVE